MPAPMKENGIQIDIEQDLLADATPQTHGQPYTDDEIELLALDHELTDFQQLQIEIHDELFQCGMGWDTRAIWEDIHHAEIPEDDYDDEVEASLAPSVEFQIKS